jgi:LPS-assembly protein
MPESVAPGRGGSAGRRAGGRGCSPAPARRAPLQRAGAQEGAPRCRDRHSVSGRPEKGTDAYPCSWSPTSLDGRTDDVAVATGEVELRKIDARVYGDKMTYWPLDDEIDATGNVRMLQDGMEINAPRVRMKMTEQVGFAEQPDYVFVREVASKFYRPTIVPVTAATSNAANSGAPMMNNVPNSYGLPTTAPPTRPSVASGTAERAEFEGENQVSLFDSTYSTCKPGETATGICARPRCTSITTATSVMRRTRRCGSGDVPIFYTPYASFPLNRKPRSGVLHPFLATSTRDGSRPDRSLLLEHRPELRRDALPSLHEQARIATGCRGALHRLQCRRLASTRPSTCLTTSWPTVSAMLTCCSTSRTSDADLRGQSITTASRIVSIGKIHPQGLLQTSQVQLLQNFTLGYTPVPWLQTNVQVQRFQTLQTDPANPVVVPYFLEPQVNLSWASSPMCWAPILTVIGQYSRFSHALADAAAGRPHGALSAGFACRSCTRRSLRHSQGRCQR